MDDMSIEANNKNNPKKQKREEKIIRLSLLELRIQYNYNTYKQL